MAHDHGDYVPGDLIRFRWDGKLQGGTISHVLDHGKKVILANSNELWDLRPLRVVVIRRAPR